MIRELYRLNIDIIIYKYYNIMLKLRKVLVSIAQNMSMWYLGKFNFYSVVFLNKHIIMIRICKKASSGVVLCYLHNKYYLQIAKSCRIITPIKNLP